MTIWRILVGLSQLTCTWAIAPPAQRQRQVADAGLAGAERVGAVRGRRPSGRRPPGRTKSRIDRSCGREVPEHVDVGLHQPEVDPHRVDEQDVAELAVVRRARGSCSTAGRVAVGVVGHQDQAAARAAAVDHLAAALDPCRRAASRPARACRRAAPRARCPGGCGPGSRWRPRRRRRGRAPRSSDAVHSTVAAAAHDLRARSTSRSHTATRSQSALPGSCGPGWVPSSPPPRRPLRAGICPCL